jgi:hypothetical protein
MDDDSCLDEHGWRFGEAKDGEILATIAPRLGVIEVAGFAWDPLSIEQGRAHACSCH